MGDTTLSGFRILLVEDSLEESFLVQALVESEGLGTVTTAQDGLSGADLAQQDAFDLMICDLNLPGFDGIEVIRQSKRTFPDRPIIVSTGYSDPEVHARARAGGADCVLTKPLDRDAFLEALWSLLAREGANGHADEEPSGESAPRLDPDPAAASSVEGPAHGNPAQTVLAIGAFPGDVILGCGGVLASHARQGWKVVILCLADHYGSAGGLEAAARRAARRLGATMVMAGVDPSDHDRAVEVIRDNLEALDPDTVLLPSAQDRNKDRMQAHDAAVEAIPADCHVYAYQTATSGIAFRPTLFASVEGTLERKLQALEAFGDQEGLEHLGRDLAIAAARYWSRHARHELVEPLELVWSPPPDAASSSGEGPQEPMTPAA